MLLLILIAQAHKLLLLLILDHINLKALASILLGLFVLGARQELFLQLVILTGLMSRLNSLLQHPLAARNHLAIEKTAASIGVLVYLLFYIILHSLKGLNLAAPARQDLDFFPACLTLIKHKQLYLDCISTC